MKTPSKERGDATCPEQPRKSAESHSSPENHTRQSNAAPKFNPSAAAIEAAEKATEAIFDLRDMRLTKEILVEHFQAVIESALREYIGFGSEDPESLPAQEWPEGYDLTSFLHGDKTTIKQLREANDNLFKIANKYRMENKRLKHLVELAKGNITGCGTCATIVREYESRPTQDLSLRDNATRQRDAAEAAKIAESSPAQQQKRKKS